MRKYWYSAKGAKESLKRGKGYVSYVLVGDRWIQYTETGEQEEPLSKGFGDLKLISETAEKLRTKHLTIEQDEAERLKEIERILKIADIDPSDKMGRLVGVGEYSRADCYMYNTVACENCLTLPAEYSNGAFKYPNQIGICIKESKTPKECLVTRFGGYTTVCGTYKGRGSVYTVYGRELAEKEAKGEFC